MVYGIHVLTHFLHLKYKATVNKTRKIGRKNKVSEQKTVTNMENINPNISIITLNVSGLNTLKTDIIRADKETRLT